MRFLTCCCVVLMAGCSYSGAPNKIKASVVPVSGVVKVGDSPLGGVVITFTPRSKAGGEAMAVTEADGSYKLGTFSKDDGAIPGGYIVSFAPAPGKTDTRIPKPYRSEQTSTLRVEIPANGGVLPTLIIK